MGKNKLKKITIILLILLTTMVAFWGVYSKVQNRMENGVKDYEYSRGLKGSRVITLKVSDETKETIKDSNGNIIESATDEEITQNGYVKESQPINGEDKLTVENYNSIKSILDARLQRLYVNDYEIRLNESNGEIEILLREDDRTDKVISSLTTVGKFEIIDAETKEVLMNNDDIKTSEALRSNTEDGVAIYLSIEFNGEGKKKLEDITKTYVKVAQTNTTAENAEGNTETPKEKQITMKIDDQDIMSTSFGEPITDGKLYLNVGNPSTDKDTLNESLEQARNMSSILSNKNMPLTYKQVGNIYVASELNENLTISIVIGIAIIATVVLFIFVIKYKLRGALATCAYIGAISLLLLIIRYTNVVLSIEGIVALFTILVANFALINKILAGLKANKDDKKVEQKKVINKAIKDFTLKVIPLFIMAVVFTFMSWVPTSSFGMVIFWGLTITVLYNLLITKSLVKDEN